MNLYRICTEGGLENEERAIRLAEEHLIGGFTVLRARGFWEGISEDSIVIEVCEQPVADSNTSGRVRYLAEKIREANKHKTSTKHNMAYSSR